MFKDNQIIGMLDDLNRKINILQSKPEGDVFKKLADIEEYCQEIKQKLEQVEENCLRDDPEFRFQIKEAMREYKEEMQTEIYQKKEKCIKEKKEVEKPKPKKK